MSAYYGINPDGSWTSYEAGDEGSLNDLKSFTQAKGQKLVTKEEYQRLTGIPSRELRKEGAYLSKLGDRYRTNPKEAESEMIDAGYDPRGGGAGKTLSQFSGVVAPGISTAQEQGMGIGGQLLGGAIDLGATLSGAKIPGMVAGAIAKKSIPTLAKYAIPAVADVASNAVGAGVQQGYGAGGFDPESAKMGGGTSGGMGVLGGAGKAISAPMFKALSHELSGVTPEALEKMARGGVGRDEILNAMPANEIKLKINDDLANWETLIPEGKLVTKALEGKTFNLNRTIDQIDNEMSSLGAGKALTPTEKIAYKKLAEWRDDLLRMPVEVDANYARKIRSQLDNAIDYNDPSIGQGAGALTEKAFKRVSATLRDELKDVGGREYASLMEAWSKKLNAVEELKTVLGTEMRQESNIKNLYGANKSAQRDIVAKFDDVFGKDYSKNIENSFFHENLGIDSRVPIEDRSPALMSRFTTGRSMLGLGAVSALTGGGAGALAGPFGLVGAVPIGAAWSPRVGVATLSEMYNPSKVAQTAQEVTRYGKSVSKNVGDKKEKKRKISDYNPNP